MQPGDPEPPHLYKPSALYNAKYEFVSKQYLYKDPIRALEIMQLNTMANVIHNIGLNPFKDHYWTNHQVHVYRAYARKEPACVYINATGGIIKPIVRYDGSKSKCIFLYIVVINHSGQFPVAQMISQRHDTQTIMTWLTEWEKSGAPTPREVVCDSSKALLSAVIRAFTGYATIKEYANACYRTSLPACYVKIDVAHFLKMYSGVLKSASHRVRDFYLATLGQLILSRTLDDATMILKSTLIIADSEIEGTLASGELTQCDVHNNSIKASLDPKGVVIEDEIPTPVSEEKSRDTIFEHNDKSDNTWCTWATEIDKNAKIIAISEESDRVNAHYLPNLASRLVNDLRWFPLCSR